MCIMEVNTACVSWRFGFLLLKNHQLYNTFLAPWQLWLGITKPNNAFSTILNASNRLLQNFNYTIEFSTD